MDEEIKNQKNFVVGANKLNYHLENVNLDRDFKAELIDLRQAVEGDICPVCGKPMKLERGIEVGQIFKLQTKYSQAMNCTYTNEEGKNVPMVMGCYGIGVTRTMAAVVEQYHDEFGIKLPLAIAPYHAIVVPVNCNDELQMKTAQEIYEKLQKAGVEVVLDDRDERPGVKFKDADLIGFPFRITAGKSLSEGVVEFKDRATGEMIKVKPDKAVDLIIKAINTLK